MREYVGPTRQATHIAFVPGDPPRLAAVVQNAAYLWRLDRPDPTVLTWEEPPAWSEPLLTPSPDGRWLVAGSNESFHRWDLVTDPPAGSEGFLTSVLTAQFTATPDRLTIVGKGGSGSAFELQAVT